MKKYLVIYKYGLELGNIGVFEAQSKDEALLIAQKEFHTTAGSLNIKVYDLEQLKDGWTLFY